ncbi:uncharacterized protein LOC107224055 isoform X1 [Neodiprion lecontei]|uniref:RNA-directed DNA polymerase n=1 Tax=Neodiprion lecontei TaxID=441921 RepID=A0ABM3GR33_NEOLC|nr:uncharacterized protein LOC107224055 isoform X1 [Neodiprion lecontei]
MDGEFLIGLDAIKKFRLCQDENLRISQKQENTKLVKKSNFSKMSAKKIDEIIQKNEKIFAKSKFDIGTVKGYEATVKLTENRYISKKPYKCSFQDKAEIENQVEELLNADLIEESSSPFAAPVTLAYKKEEGKKQKNRLCMDFKELNKIIVPESQPFPRIEDLTVRARNCKFFTKLDVNSAFWSIPIRAKDRYKLAFVTHNRHLQWKCLPFGLKSASAIFQRVLAGIIKKNKLDAFTVNYIDDILVFSKTYEEHLQHVDIVLQILHDQGFKLNKNKCQFAQERITYLGHEIENNMVKPINDNLVAIKNFPIPTSITHIRQFLGKVNFYLEFIPNHVVLLDPLRNLLRKNVTFHWSEECRNSFNLTKQFLCTVPALAIFDPEAPIFIFTDASNKGVGAILKQPQKDNSLKSVFFFSRKLTDAQKRKKAIYIEALAIKEAILYWQFHLIGKKFIIFTDHKPLENFNIKKCSDMELVNILNYISMLDFDIIYNPGKENSEADCLSRNPVLEPREDTELDYAIRTSNLLKLIDIKENQKALRVDDKCIIKENIIYKVLNKREKIWITEDFGKSLIKDMHVDQGHIGTKQLILTFGQKFYFKNMYKHIKMTCRSCETCIKNKSRIGCFKAPLSQLGPAKEPFEIISIDTIGGFKGNKSTKKYLHLAVDHFTRFTYIVTSKTQMAKDFINLIKKIEKNGNIKLILSDQYPGINSTQFKQHLSKQNIALVFTAVDCAFSNGLNERTNQTLVNRIRCRIYEHREKSWPQIAEECTQDYNNTIHSSTGFTPNYLLTGSNKSFLPDELNDNNLSNLISNREIAFRRSKQIHDQNKEYYDKNVKRIDYKVGDLVYVQSVNKLNKDKLDPIRTGPFRIKKKISDVMFLLNSRARKNESNIFHASKLVPYFDDALHRS